MSEDKKDLATIPKGMEDMMTLERPEGKDEGTLGNEGIGRNDVLMPRIGLAQKMSPEIDKTNPRYIEGLEFTDLFHSTQRKRLGPGPLHFIILRRDNPRWVEFRPIDQGGGIVDPNVRKGDERTKFGPAGEKPVATEFHDFIVLLLTGFDPKDPMASIAALSLKSSGIKAAKALNLLITMRGPKTICKGIYTVKTGSATDKKTQGVYAVYKFDNAGWLKPDSPMEKLALDMFEAWKDREVVIDADETPDPDEFDPAAYEASAGKGDHPDM